MKNDKIQELLNQKAKSPAPELTPDPFLVTRIEALIDSERQKTPERSLISNWSFASVITAGAIILGIYVGAGISETDNLQINADVFNEYSQAFYQSGFVENLNNAMINKEVDQ